ncbi:unnamed protein product [Cylindrotheca closterium]|uniref:DUF6824 domain-containing protein n=1 Tax=Cylindrotheca closterium TaxID=2856 RepID=A0AAD2PX63_9STRA|nr:unnamed protein product [Cylindrotheca closterium]
MSKSPDTISNKSSCLRRCDCSDRGNTTNQLANCRNRHSIYEDTLVEGMQHLSFDQIQHEQELLHGVADEVKLNENTINDLLLRLEMHLNRMKKGTAFESAQRQDPSYVSNRELQLAFLRAKRFEPKGAAEKLINHFKYKRDLFGEGSLVRDITAQDLGQDDLTCLLEGFFQYSPFRDRSGRTILLEFPGIRSKRTIRTLLRARFYAAANNVETMVDLSKGTVIVSYFVEKYQDHLNGSGFVETAKFYHEAVPLKTDGFHLCCSSSFECMVTRACIALIPHRDRVKSRVHFGSHTECQYLLASYGIFRAALPLKGPDNEMDLNHHNAWFQRRKLREIEKPQHMSVHIPSSDVFTTHQRSTPCHRNSSSSDSGNANDVLCLGKRIKGVGNERLHSLALSYATAYRNGSFSNRRTIVSGIIDEVHRHGGRFLKPDPQVAGSMPSEDEGKIVWVELTRDEQRAKVTQLFRNLRHHRSRQGSIVSNNATAAAPPSLLPSGAPVSTASSLSTSPPVIVEKIGPHDVLFGYQLDNPGNQRLRELVFGLADEYNRTDRGEKKKKVLQLLGTIRNRGGRFLKPCKDGTGWEVVSDEVARKKVSMQFRNLRRSR